jgi:hypothetical protein
MNREMKPGWVWLQLIPIFGQIWQFVVVTRIANSIWKEMESNLEESILGDSRERIDELNERPTFKIGIAYCVLFTMGLVINYLTSHRSPYLQLIGAAFTYAGMTCWIIYWVRLARNKNKLIKLTVKSAIPVSLQANN